MCRCRLDFRQISPKKNKKILYLKILNYVGNICFWHIYTTPHWFLLLRSITQTTINWLRKPKTYRLAENFSHTVNDAECYDNTQSTYNMLKFFSLTPRGFQKLFCWINITCHIDRGYIVHLKYKVYLLYFIFSISNAFRHTNI